MEEIKKDMRKMTLDELPVQYGIKKLSNVEEYCKAQGWPLILVKITLYEIIIKYITEITNVYLEM